MPVSAAASPAAAPDLEDLPGAAACRDARALLLGIEGNGARLVERRRTGIARGGEGVTLLQRQPAQQAAFEARRRHASGIEGADPGRLIRQEAIEMRRPAGHPHLNHGAAIGGEAGGGVHRAEALAPRA